MTVSNVTGKLLPAVTAVLSTAVLSTAGCGSTLAAGSLAISWPGRVGGSPEAAVVDVDTSLARRHVVGAGTGIVLDAQGAVVTNNHVIEGASAISATDIGNGRTYPVKVLGHDRRHDLALLQLVGATGLATANLGDSNSVAVGDQVVGFGNAGGKGGLPSRVPGIVAALNQTVRAGDDLTGRSERLTGVIAISAALRPGDSGGPLCNNAGQVIGIDTAADRGHGFAIPIDEALQVVHEFAPG